MATMRECGIVLRHKEGNHYLVEVCNAQQWEVMGRASTGRKSKQQGEGS